MDRPIEEAAVWKSIYVKIQHAMPCTSERCYYLAKESAPRINILPSLDRITQEGGEKGGRGTRIRRRNYIGESRDSRNVNYDARDRKSQARRCSLERPLSPSAFTRCSTWASELNAMAIESKSPLFFFLFFFFFINGHTAIWLEILVSRHVAVIPSLLHRAS